ncbi:unnamed protein product [Caenorhabditis sp. 36 PRJEB53466]|nr:unnamed protein product [Caenorhabditis sp. 36 PRJEB53466]
MWVYKKNGVETKKEKEAKMVVFVTATPCRVTTAKVLVLALTVLFCAIYIGSLFFKNGYFVLSHTFSLTEILVVAVVVALEILLTVIVLLECKCLILVALIILGIMLFLTTLEANYAFLVFAIGSYSVYGSDAIFYCIGAEIVCLIIVAVYYIRYYCILTVYRWTRVPRVSARAGPPNISVHTANLH